MLTTTPQRVAPVKAGDTDSLPTTRVIALRRDDAVAGLCGVWMIAGLFLDGWAHRNQKPESFFSPWHGILYSGFLASSLWMLKVARAHHIPGTSLQKTLPIGYGFRSIGVAVFGVGAVADLIWHQVFGIEVNVEALLSPSHLLLLSGGLLMACGPIVSTLAREQTQDRLARGSWASTGPIVATVAFITALMQFFLMYLSPFDNGLYAKAVTNEALNEGGRWLANELRTRGVASIFLFTLSFVLATLWLVRNINLPTGTFFVMWLIPSVLQTLLSNFDSARTLIGPFAAALLAELTWPAIRQRQHNKGLLAGWLASMMLVLWFGFFLGVRLEGQLSWQVELWTGVPTFAALLTALIVLGSSEPTSKQTPSPSSTR
jgi:hypothetical protein